MADPALKAWSIYDPQGGEPIPVRRPRRIPRGRSRSMVRTPVKLACEPHHLPRQVERVPDGRGTYELCLRCPARFLVWSDGESLRLDQD
jgi:hypothetical protein